MVADMAGLAGTIQSFDLVVGVCKLGSRAVRVGFLADSSRMRTSNIVN
jgi:hypothetical protein